MYVLKTTDDPLRATVEFVSDRAEHIAGFKPAAFRKDPGLWLSLIHPDDVSAVQQLTARILAGKSAGTRLYRLRNGAGDYRWIEDRIVPVLGRSGKVTGMTGVARDVTERRRTEERLQSAEQTFQAVFDTALDAILLADDAARYVDANPAACALLGYSREELLRMSVWDITPAPNRESGLDLWRRFIAAGTLSGEYTLRCKDGSTRETEFRAVARVLPGLHLSVLRDISERKRAEAERARLLRRLVDLQEAERREIARELHDEVGQLLAGLRLMLETGDGWKLHGKDASPAAIVSDLMARVRALWMNLRPPVLDDLGLVPALLWLSERYSAQTHVRVDFLQAGASRRFSREVETAAFRIIQEALTNVARHAAAAAVRVRLWADKERLRARIEDHGRGFDTAAALAGDTRGLAGMRERAALLGGELVIESSSGAGTRLSLELPLAAAPERGG